MKRTILLAGLLTGACAILLSNARGPAASGNGNRTGGPGSTGTCSSCHSGGVLSNANITVRDKNDLSIVTKYKPGTTYRVDVSDMHPSNFYHGFQVMVVGSDNKQAGSFQNLGSDHQSRTVDNIVLVEHSTAIMQQGASFNTSFDWVAPAAGRGAINFYASINATNNDGSVSGDAVSNPLKLTIPEDGVSVKDAEPKQQLTMYPNPVLNVLNIRPSITYSGDVEICILGLDGNRLLSSKLTANNDVVSIPVSHLPGGIYNVLIINKETKHSALFVKQ